MLPNKALETINHIDNSLQAIMSPHHHQFIKGHNMYDNNSATIVGIKYAQFTKQEYVLLQLHLVKAYNHCERSYRR